MAEPFERSDLRLADAAPILGRATGIAPETIAGFIMIPMCSNGEVGIACSENIDPHMAAPILEGMAAVLFKDIREREEKAGQN